MTLKKFVVHKANIKDEKGNKKFHEEVVELGPVLARHYGKLGFLRPYFADGEEVEDGDADESGMGKPTPQPVRSRRTAPKPPAPETPNSSTTEPVGPGDGAN